MSRSLRLLPALFWAAAIFWLSSAPRALDLSFPMAGLDKVVHAGAFGLLTLLILFGASWPVRAWAYWAAAIAGVYGVLDEAHQAFVPGRNADLFDALADAMGALFVAAVWLRVAKAGRRAKPAASASEGDP